MIDDYAIHEWKEGDFYFYYGLGARLLEVDIYHPFMWKVRIYDEKYERTLEKTIHVIELRTEKV